jgi:transcriptional regulator with XRE-family HTH domain
LRRRRIEIDHTQLELAQRVGCKQQSISLWESGYVKHSPIKKYRRMLEAIFDTTIGELLKNENSPDREAEAAMSTVAPPQGKRYDRE